MDLPMEQLWFNILLRALITVYSANGIGNFIAYIPGMSREDAEILGYNRNSNNSFQLTSSLIFCLLGIAQFRYPILVYLTIAEIVIIIISYLYLIERKLNYMDWKKVNLRKMREKRSEDIKPKKR